MDNCNQTGEEFKCPGQNCGHGGADDMSLGALIAVAVAAGIISAAIDLLTDCLE
jgi:hypothetical protein